MEKQLSFFTPTQEAKFSKDGKRRLHLYRIWNPDLKYLLYIGLNPSTANEEKNDPTICKLINFTANYGYGGFYIVNLFTTISPHPKVLHKDIDNIAENLKNIFSIIHDNYLKIEKVVFCWGNFETHGRDKVMKELFSNAYCFKKNSNGSPAHPLYLEKETELIKYFNDEKTSSNPKINRDNSLLDWHRGFNGMDPSEVHE